VVNRRAARAILRPRKSTWRNGFSAIRAIGKTGHDSVECFVLKAMTVRVVA